MVMADRGTFSPIKWFEFMVSLWTTLAFLFKKSHAFAQTLGDSRRMQKRAESLPGTVSASFPGPKEGGRDKEKHVAPEAEYLSSRCVLFTYYQGDISSVVDEHFSRALSSYIEGDGKRRATELGAGKSRATVTCSVLQRHWDHVTLRPHLLYE